MSAFVLWILPAAGAAVLCYVYGRYNIAATLADWDLALSPRSRRLVDLVHLEVAGTRVSTASMLRNAAAARLRGDRTEARRLLALTSQVLAEDTPSRLERLRQMSRLVRLASAVAPAPPLRAARYELASVRAVAALAHPLHHVLVTSTERFVLRVHVVLVGLQLALGAVRRSGAQAASAPNLAALGLLATALSRAVADWTRLDEEHLASFRILLASLDAVRRTRPEVVWTDL